MKKTTGLISLITGICMSLACVFAHADSDTRRALWQIQSKQVSPVGRQVAQIDEDSALSSADVQVGDIILSINEELITDANKWWDWVYAIRGGSEYQLLIKRGESRLLKTLKFDPAPRESHKNLTTEYGWITSDYGLKQRTIVTLPNSRKGKVPAVFVVGGLSCSSVEYTPGRQSNFIRSLQYMIQNVEMTVMRIEKPGVGDSEGRCSETDFNTELNGYEVALQTLLADPRVDRQKVVVYGSSMGSALAPYLASKYQLNGVIADGTFYRSWFEHMLEIERRILAMQGDDQSTVNRKIITAYIPLYYGMLISKKSYAQVIDENPLLAEYNYHDPEHMYGRPMSFYHQMQDFDFAGHWSKLTVPARLRWGTNDWIMSEYDIDIIDQVLADAGNTNVQIYKYPGLDHWDTVHESALNSFQGKPGRWEEKIGKQLVEWAKELNADSNVP